jgi:hypothetical protein
MSRPAVSSSDFSPMFHSIMEGISKYLPSSSLTVAEIMESSAMVQMTHATVRNIPYAFLAKEFGINDLCHALTSRVTFFEATLVCLVSLVHHVFFASVYTCLSLMTLGLSEHLNFTCKKHWAHLSYSLVGSGVGFVGVFYPYAGAGLHLKFLIYSVQQLQKSYKFDVNLFERPLVREIQTICHNNFEVIRNFFHSRTDEWKFRNTYLPSIEEIERRVEKAQRMEDLLNLTVDIYRQWPYLEKQKKWMGFLGL